MEGTADQTNNSRDIWRLQVPTLHFICTRTGQGIDCIQGWFKMVLCSVIVTLVELPALIWTVVHTVSYIFLIVFILKQFILFGIDIFGKQVHASVLVVYKC